MRENELIGEAVAWLRERLPLAWAADVRLTRQTSRAKRAAVAIEIRSPKGRATLAVEARSSLRPRDAEVLLALRKAVTPTVVVAPWLSARTRELLAAEGINYVDLTGNALMRLDSPALFIETQGAGRDPAPPPRPKPRVRGSRAGRLIRVLVDVRPPYGVRELAQGADLAPGYVSRLLDALDDDALVERSKRGRVESVDVAGLLRRWTEGYEVFKSNDAATFLAPRGLARTLSLLAQPAVGPAAAVTGSFAATRLAPVAAPRLLVIYSDNVPALADALELIPADTAANVALLRPFDRVVWQHASEQDGVRYVAPSQVAADCLTGNGRMPSEGEGLVRWMLDHEQDWRLSSLADLQDDRGLESHRTRDENEDVAVRAGSRQR